MIGRAKRKFQRLNSFIPGQDSKSKAVFILGKSAEINTIIKYLKDIGMVVLLGPSDGYIGVHILFNSFEPSDLSEYSRSAEATLLP